MPIFNTKDLPTFPEFRLGPSQDLAHSSDEESENMFSVEKETDPSKLSALFKSMRISSLIPALKSAKSTTFMTENRLESRKSSSQSSSMVKSDSIMKFVSKQSNSTLLNLKRSFTSDSQSMTKKNILSSKEHRSLFLFEPNNPFRLLLIRIITSKLFDSFILLCIALNCISLALNNPSNSPQLLQILMISEWIFAGIFLLELVLKVISLGFVLHPGSYLRSFWNILDFVIVIMSFLQFLPGINNYSALRSLRALRPLRTVNGIPGLRLIVNALFLSIPPFLNVLALLIFCFCIFGILGVQLWKGSLRSRCVFTDSAVDGPNGKTWSYPYDYNGNEILCSSMFWGRKCPHDPDMKIHCEPYASDNPNYGYSNFDNIGAATMQVFQVVSGEMWIDLLYLFMDGWSDLAVIYYIILVLFGGFFIVNLALAVINEKFNQVAESSRVNRKSSNTLEIIKKKMKKRRITSWILKCVKFFDYTSDKDVNGSENDLSDDGSASGERFSSSDFNDDTTLSSNRMRKVKKFRKSFQRRNVSDMTEEMNNDEQSSRRSRESQWSLSHAILLPFYVLLWIHRKTRRFVNHLVRNDWFGRAMLAVIILNTIFLAVDHHGMPRWLKQFTEIANYVFIGIFTVELILRLYGIGISFFLDGFNLLDLLVIVASYLEIILGSTSSFSILRSFRLLRILKLLSWKSLRHLTDSVLKSLKSIFYLGIVFLLFMFIASLIGMQLFSGNILPEEDGRPPVQNFDDFIHSFVTVFQIVTTEDWPKVYWNAMRSQSGDVFSQFMTVLYFVGTIILGDYIILNLFIAILLQSFEEESQTTLMRIKSEKSVHQSMLSLNELESKSTSGNELMVQRQSSMSSIGEIMQSSRSDSSPLGNFFKNYLRKWKELKFIRRNTKIYKESTLDTNLSQNSNGEISTLDETSYNPDSSTSDVYSDPLPLKGRSMFLFPPKNRLRTLLRRVFIHPLFVKIHIGFITIASLVLILDNPELDPSSVLARTLLGIYSFVALLTFIEILVRMFVQGIIYFTLKRTKAVGYLNDLWNVFDVCILVIYTTSVVLDYCGIHATHALYAVYPLRLILYFKGLKTIFSTLIKAIPGIVNVLILCMLTFLIFGIFAMQTFMGRLHYCSLEHINAEADCLLPNGVNRTSDFYWDPASKTCEMQPAFEATLIRESDCTFPMLWISNNRWSYDNIFSSMLSLFEVSTIESWPDASNTAVSIVGVGMQPKKDNNIFYAFFFLVFIIIGSWFIMNLFVGVILSSFNRIKENEEGSGTLSDEQRVWVATQRLFMKLSLKPKLSPPKSHVRNFIFKIVSHPKFEYLISAIIFLNVILMALEFDQMPTTMSQTLTYVNYSVTVIFIIEALLKLLGFGPFQYFRDLWNAFDFLVVLISILGSILTSIDNQLSVDPTILRLFRILRIIRILRLIKTTKRVRALIETLYYSAPSLVNVSLAILLLSYVYAIIGMNLFHKVKLGSDLNSWTNFSGFFNAMLTMIRIATLEDWGNVMYDCRNLRNCTGDDCGNPYTALPFFLSYILFNSYIVMNLFVAVILDNFENQMRFEDSAINSSDLRNFIEIWQEYDPKATYVIKTKYLKNLLQGIGPPLGLPKNCSRAELIRKLVSLDIPEHQGEIHFIETLIPLARRVYSVDLPEMENRKLDIALMKKFSSLKKMKSTLGYTTGEYFAATFIQAAYRGRQVRRSGANVIGLSLVRTVSGKLRFKIERKAHRYVKQRQMEKILRRHEPGFVELSEDSDSDDSDASEDKFSFWKAASNSRPPTISGEYTTIQEDEGDDSSTETSLD